MKISNAMATTTASARQPNRAIDRPELWDRSYEAGMTGSRSRDG